MNEAILEILKFFDLNKYDIVLVNYMGVKFIAEIFIEETLKSKNAAELCNRLNTHRNQLTKIFKNIFYKKSKRGGTLTYGSYLLNVTSYKKCTKCEMIKLATEFRIENKKTKKIRAECILCEYKYRQKNLERTRANSKKHYQKNKQKYLAKSRKRELLKKNRIPKWVNDSELNKITEFYKKCPKGFHVDHIIPLQGTNVSGFHCLNNLQYLTSIENLKKGNKGNKWNNE